jgi:hypothetical protein
MTGLAQGRPAPVVSDRPLAAHGWGQRALIALAILFSLVLALPVATLVVRSVAGGALADAAAS